ncbi:MAG: LacI family DNA-binding transcriptional regulator [Bryobacteraceae bacterium]
MATIKEVAQRARVSVGTVSNVLGGNVPVSSVLRERVQAVVRELDYHPNHVARSLKMRETKTLGMVITDITNPFYPQLVRGAEDAAWKRHYMLITFNSDDQLEREKVLLSALRTRRVDGILLVAAATDGDHAHIRAAIDAGIPVVCLDRIPTDLAIDGVAVDNVAGARTCIEHLISLGHRRIGILAGPLDLQVCRDRLLGYQEALAAAGIALDPGLIVDGGMREETGYPASQKLLKRRPRPSAIFASNAIMGLGLIRAVHESGLQSPGDVAIATFDDPPFSRAINPPLTAVAQPSYQLGYQGAELLIERIHDPSRKHIRLLLQTELKIRESSVGRPAAENRPVRSAP